MKLISENYSFREGPLTQVEYSEEQRIRDLLLGRSVTKVTDDHLLLDNGTLVKVVANDGGCACGAGDYEIAGLGETENVITNVEFDYQPADDGAWFSDPKDAPEGHGHYRVFVLAGDKRINLIDVEGDDGNGYYGTGYWLLVRDAEADE